MTAEGQTRAATGVTLYGEQAPPPPRLFRAEMLAYKSLVTPPAYLQRAITGWPTAYGAPFVPPYGETSGISPLALALDHCVWALPF